MGIIFASSGILSDFDTDQTLCYQVGSKGRTSDYSIVASTSASFVRRAVPLADRYNTSFYVSSFGGNAGTRIVEFLNGVTRIGWLRTKTTTYQLEAVVGSSTVVGTSLSTTSLQTNTVMHIEVDYKVNSTAGWFKVYVNGVLEIDFAGNTGTAIGIDLIQYAPYYLYMSDIAIKNDGRIGDLRIAYLPISSAGDFNDFKGVECVNNIAQASGAGSASKANTSFFVVDPVLSAGVFTKFEVSMFYLGSIKIMVFRRNASNNANIDVVYSSPLITPGAGLNTFYAGQHFEAFNVLPGDYIGMYCDSSASPRTLYTSYNYPGYATLSGDRTGQTNLNFFGSLGSSPAAYKATIEISNTSDYHKALIYNPCLHAVDSGYIYAETANNKSLYNISDVSNIIDTGVIVGLQVTSRVAYQGETIKNSEVVVKAGSTESSFSVGTLTTATDAKVVMLANNPTSSAPWTRSDINSVQIGVIAKE